MNYNLDKVIPPPATFAADMTQTESAIMSKHIAYWADLLNKDVAVAFGRSPTDGMSRSRRPFAAMSVKNR